MKKIFSWKTDSKTSGFIAYQKSPQCTHSLPLPIFGRPNHLKSLLFIINDFKKRAFRWNGELVSFARISTGGRPIFCTFYGNFRRGPYHVMAIESNRAGDASKQRWKSTINPAKMNKFLVILIERRKLKSMKNWKLHVITVCVGRVFRRIHFSALNQYRISWCTHKRGQIELELLFSLFRGIIWICLWSNLSDDCCNEALTCVSAIQSIGITVNFDEIETIR